MGWYFGNGSRNDVVITVTWDLVLTTVRCDDDAALTLVRRDDVLTWARRDDVVTWARHDDAWHW